MLKIGADEEVLRAPGRNKSSEGKGGLTAVSSRGTIAAKASYWKHGVLNE